MPRLDKESNRERVLDLLNRSSVPLSSSVMSQRLGLTQAFVRTALRELQNQGKATREWMKDNCESHGYVYSLLKSPPPSTPEERNFHS